MKRAIACVIAAAGLSASALAELPPRIYEQERSAASDVIILSGIDVAGFEGPGTSGICTLTGRVERAERGERYSPGERAAVRVACVTKDHPPMPGPFPGYSTDGLRQLQLVRAFLNGDVVVRRGLDAVD
jgi:hypothetical protein